MIFDAHADILTDMYNNSKKGNTNSSFRDRHLNLYKEAGITTSIFVNYTNPLLGNEEMFEDIFKVSIKEITENKDILKICLNIDDINDAKASNKIGIIIGVEGLKYLKGINHLDRLYKKGLRHLTLTWNEQNQYGSGLGNPDGGLTESGIELIKHAEKLGIIIDLAHSSPKTFDDILAETTKPVIISHGNCKSLCNHRRNYTDEQLLKLKVRDGVIGFCAVAAFISEDKENQTVEYLAKHIDYAIKLIGIDHVGVGLDVCYYLGNEFVTTRVKGLEQINQVSKLFQCLKNMDYSDNDLEKIKHVNFERVVQQLYQT